MSYLVYVRREVILSAGAIGSPQLLMLSGIGPRKHLREIGVRLVFKGQLLKIIKNNIISGSMHLRLACW